MNDLELFDFFNFFKKDNFIEHLYDKFVSQGELLKNEKNKAVFRTPGNHFIDETTGVESIVYPTERVLDFQNDFIPKLIEINAEKYLNFCKKMEIKLLNNLSSWYYFLDSLAENLFNDKLFFKQSKNLNNYPSIRKKLLETIEGLLLNFNSKLEPPTEIHKIKLGLKKTEICFLFYWMLEAGYFPEKFGIEKLSKILQTNFMRKASIDKDVYLEMKDSTSELSKIKKGEIIPSERLIKFLKDIINKHDK
ncbi:hypothetical protein H9I45_15300 [Polaribacter haliotis]|uniref:Uncharacterized protein n=1 Tax=Polaribacter haliotis TaxID=1888915 RepID=A0A7L8AF94_9FLAO|nr:hypothetical protein [Polaribacter haliotis]QOD60685.1 hypothetical protein H9I45_15300 [Polaribacter haliotis]